MSMPAQTLHLLSSRFAVCRLPAADPLPAWAAGSPFQSLTRTAEELSVVCLQELVPGGVQHEPDWRCFQVRGPIPFGVVGVVAALATPLAQAGIPLFILSTFDTDYVLVKAERLEAAVRVLRAAGHDVTGVGV